MPAITACLMASLLGISITNVGFRRCLSRYSCSAVRVPEAGSRTMKGSSANACAGTLSARAKRCVGAVTSTCGCIAKGSARLAKSTGARPITHRSTSLASIKATSCSRLPRRSRTSTAGCSVWNRASSCGRKYLALLTMPMVNRPDSSRAKRAIASSASFSVPSRRRA